MSNSPPYHHGDLRQELLRKAITIIVEEGTDALTLRGLARSLGVSHAAPSRHFPTRNDLLCALALEGVEAMIERALSSQSDDETPLERLRYTARGYLDWACEHPAYHQILRNPDVMRYGDERLTARLKENMHHQRDVLSAAQADGWRSETPLEEIAMEYAALLAGWATIATDQTYALVFDQSGGLKAAYRAIDRYLGLFTRSE